MGVLAGLIVGASIGVVITCCCVVAGQSDRREEELKESYDKYKTE